MVALARLFTIEDHLLAKGFQANPRFEQLGLYELLEYLCVVIVNGDIQARLSVKYAGD